MLIHRLLPLLGVLSFVAGSFDLQSANAAVYLSAQAYCQESYYFAREYGSDIPDFVPTKSLDKSGGLIGFSNMKSTIYVVTRGSHTISEFIRDNEHETEMKPYNKCEGCKVHGPLYRAEKEGILPIKEEVSRLKAVYPNYKLVVTGHGVGGSLATLTAIDLSYEGFAPISLMTFGAPKVGNEQFAQFAVDVLPHVYRITHSRDIGPHVSESQEYSHLPGTYRQCSTNCVISSLLNDRGVLRERAGRAPTLRGRS